MGEMTLGNEFETRMDFHLQWADKFLRENKISMKLNPPKETDLKAALDKAKGKKAQFHAVLKLPMLFIELRVPGAKPFIVGAKDLDSLRDNGKVGDMLYQWTGSNKLVTQSEYYKWQETHMSEAQASFARGTINEMKQSQEKLTAEQAAITAYVFPEGSAQITRQLHEYTKPKSWEHYLHFVEAVDGKKDAKSIYTTYIADGATAPINLPPGQKAPLADAVASDKVPDFKAARDLIAKMINAKFVPEMTKARKAEIKKELDRLKTAIPEHEKSLKKGGG